MVSIGNPVMDVALIGGRKAVDDYINICVDLGIDIIEISSIARSIDDDDVCKLIEKVSGIKISSKDIKKILLSLGFEIDKNFKITVPSWRPDVSLPIDIVEEVIRIYGLNNVESLPLKNSDQPSKPILTHAQKNTNLVRRNLASRGLIENISYSFVSSEFSDLSPKGRKPIKLLNPISEDLSDMRSSPLISLLNIAHK